MSRWVCLGAWVTGLSLLSVDPVDAQIPLGETPRPCEYEGTCAPWWATEVAVIGANGLIGGLTAGIWQELRGGSFADGFARGSLGGVLGYAGKRITTGRFPAAGLLGRQVAAVGHSVVRNAAEGRGTFSRVALPLLFLPARVQLGDWGNDARVRVTALPLWYFGYGLLNSRVSLDLGRSLWWGTPVFITDPGYTLAWDGVPHSALTTVGAVFLDRTTLAWQTFDAVGAHERVHVIQIDFSTLAWGDPGDDWLERAVPALGSVSRYVAPSVFLTGLLVVQSLLLYEIDYYHRPWEIEAMALDGDLP